MPTSSNSVMQMSDPLPREVLLVANSIFQLCGEACITGSAPLTKHFYNVWKGSKGNKLSPPVAFILKNNKNNDVDIFAPFSPQRLADSRKFDKLGITNGSMTPLEIAQTRSQYINFQHPKFSFQTFMEFLLNEHGYRVLNHKPTFIDPYSIDERNYWPWSGATSAGIAEIHNFDLFVKSKQFRMQLILVDSYPPPNQDWLTFITTNFDIDIVKGGVEIQNLDSLGTLLFSPKLICQISSGTFNYVVMPFVTFKQMLKRIYKCTNRGFKLGNLTFHPNCSSAFKRAIMFRLHHLFGPKLCYQWFAQIGINEELARHLLDEHVLPCLVCPRNWDRMFSYVEEQAFRSTFRHHGWMTPGLQRYSSQLVEEKIRQLRRSTATTKIKTWLRNILRRKKTTSAALMLQNWWRRLSSKTTVYKIQSCKRQKITL